MLERYLDALLFELQGANDFLMALPAEDRASWEGLSADIRSALKARADKWLDESIPELSASACISFSRAGIAQEYACAHRTRRLMLRDLTIGACLIPDGRYDLRLADVVWAICEESSWILPGSNPAVLNGLPLPDVREPRVDRAAAATAAALAMTVQMAASRLDAVSPQLIERIEYETEKRVLRPFMTLTDFNWMCGSRSDALSCLTDCTLCALTIIQDDRQRWQFMRKAWMLFDRQLETLPADGSIPGGVESWQSLAEPIMDMVMMVLSVSRGRVDVRREKQIRLMCHYPVFCHAAQGLFVSPGRHSMQPTLGGRAMYRLGAYIGDEALCDLGVFLARTRPEQDDSDALLHYAADIFNREAIDSEPLRPPFRRQGYFSAAQLMVARRDEDSERSLALIAHGGSNAAVDTHADIGDFLLFAEGETVLTDAGFLEESQYHNLPVIGALSQGLGAQHRAEDVSCRLEEDYAMLSMNLAAAYPQQAGILAWQRTLIYEREDGAAQLIDVFDLRRPQSVSFNFITPFEPALGERYAQLGPVRMRWEDGLSAECTPIPVPEGEWRALWGETLYRITLTTAEEVDSGKYTFSFNALRTFGGRAG